MTKVMVFGSFDPLHEGHLDFFRQAKALGDTLIVVVARDDSIKKNKNHEPRIDEKTRLKTVKKSETSGIAVLGDTDNYGKVIENYKPDIIAVGYDQKIPETLKDTLKKYKIVTLKAYKPEVFKSSRLYKK